MPTILEIEKRVIDCKNEVEVYLSEEEITNRLLDNIISFTNKINDINLCYLKLYPILDGLSSCTVKTNKEFNAIKDILQELSNFNRKASVSFSYLSKSDIIKSGCQSALSDLRANIRTLREYLEDVEETFLLKGEDIKIDNILAELA